MTRFVDVGRLVLRTTFNCVDLKKCLDTLESNFALNILDDIFVCCVEATGEYIFSNKILFNLFIARRIAVFIDPASPGLHWRAGKQFLLLPTIRFLKFAAF